MKAVVTTPFFQRLSPGSFLLRTTDVLVRAKLPEGIENGYAWRERQAGRHSDRSIAMEMVCASRFAKAAVPLVPACARIIADNLSKIKAALFRGFCY